MTVIQTESVILPAGFYNTVPVLTEDIDDALEHTSVEFEIREILNKNILITAVEVVAAGIPGPLNCWVELSPVLSTTSAAYWTAIGGGGGAIAPVVPVVEFGTGVLGTIHAISIPWDIHSRYARLVIQTPAPIATAYWTVQAMVCGKK